MTKKRIKKKGGPLSKPLKTKIINQLKELFNQGDIMYLSERDLCNRFKIARETVRKYLQEVTREIPPKDLQLIALRFREYLEDAIEDIRACWKQNKQDNNTREMRQDIELMFKAIEKFTDFLERFHLKPKAVDYSVIKQEKIEKIQVEIITKRIKDDE